MTTGFIIAQFNPFKHYKTLVVTCSLPDEIKSQKDKSRVFPACQIRIVYMQRKAHSIDTVESCAASPMNNFRKKNFQRK